MAVAPDVPADTTMMRIVHQALRRDLAWAHAVLSGPDGVRGEQRRAIGAHLGWLMRFLHAPPIPRFLLLHGYAGRYRRHAEACWGAGPPRRVQLENRVSVTVAAGVDEVWDVLCDVTRVGEWSHECVDAEWLDGAREAVPGARFRGRNRAGRVRWGRVCEIVAVERYELVWITVATALYRDSVEWRITLTEVEGGTSISQEFRALRAPKALVVLFAYVVPGHRERSAALVEDLRRLGAVAAGTRTSV